MATDQPSITCPRCGKTSYHPDDVKQGYCGNCHDWTQLGTSGAKIINNMPRDRDALAQQLGPLRNPDGTWSEYDSTTIPDHPDVKLMGEIVDYHDSIPFSETFQADLASMSAVAGFRAQKMQDQVYDEEQDFTEDQQRSVREGGVLLWLDGFTAGQRFQQRRTGQPEIQVYQAPPEEHAFYDGNRRQRRRKGKRG